jgi:two-component system chemotaxis response regulator CheB
MVPLNGELTPISVLIVDDSAFMRRAIAHMVARDPALRVAGRARDGEEALKQVELLRPDVITLDIEMPIVDGVKALKRIMTLHPTPTIMFSSRTQAGAQTTLQCLETGAIDFIAKPSSRTEYESENLAQTLIAKIKMAAAVPASCLAPQVPTLPRCGSAPGATQRTGSPPKVIVIGASTGGPRALTYLMESLPQSLNVPMVIVQHMPPGFTQSLATRLDGLSQGYHVREAVEGDLLTPGVALVAPGGRHLEFDLSGAARVTTDPPVHSTRPSADVTIASLTRLYGGSILAVLLTGMGKDGAQGLKTVRRLGGHTLAEDESTCIVYGMPRAALEMGAVERMLPLSKLPDAIAEIAAAPHPPILGAPEGERSWHYLAPPEMGDGGPLSAAHGPARR